MNLRSPLRAGAVALASFSLVVAGLSGSPAHADDSGDVAPVAVDDTVHVSSDDDKQADVLANDSDPDDPMDLGVCRVTVPRGVPLAAEIEHTQTGTDERGDPVYRDVIDVQPTGAQEGSYQLTYYACDYQYLMPATLTVEVGPSQAVTVTRVTGHRGVFSFHNPSSRRFHVRYEGGGSRPVKGRFVLEPRSSHRVRVHTPYLQWEATSRHSGFGGVVMTPIRPHAQPGSSRAGSPGTGVGPTTNPDRVRVAQGQFTLAPVLDNDGNPPSAHVQVCRATVPPNSGLQAQPLNGGRFVIFSASSSGRRPPRTTPVVPRPRPTSNSELLVSVPPGIAAGTYQVTYYACDFERLTPATVTVTVVPHRDVTAVALPHHPGLVRFHNPSADNVEVVYLEGTGRHQRSHGIRLGGHSSKLVRVATSTLPWYAYNLSGGGAGTGVVRHIPQPTPKSPHRA